MYKCPANPARNGQDKSLLYLLDSTRSTIGQFGGPYSTVRPAKSKTLFLRAKLQDKEIQ